MSQPAMLRASVYWHDAQGQAWLRELSLPPGATVGDAVRASELAQLLPDASWSESGGELRLAVFGRLRAVDDRLRDGDRVDITRGLRVDPKEARRLRAQARRARR